MTREYNLTPALARPECMRSIAYMSVVFPENYEGGVSLSYSANCEPASYLAAPDLCSGAAFLLPLPER